MIIGQVGYNRANGLIDNSLLSYLMRRAGGLLIILAISDPQELKIEYTYIPLTGWIALAQPRGAYQFSNYKLFTHLRQIKIGILQV